MTDVYTLPEWAAFVAAIREQPDDDLRRLVAADWLDERGEGERAELIRVQVERARTPDRAACDRCRRDWQRVNKSSYPVPMSWCPECRTDGPFWPDVMESLRLRDRENHLKTIYDWRCWTDADEAAGLNTYGDRGFVDRVSGPLSVLHGGDCLRCGGGHRVADIYRPSLGDWIETPTNRIPAGMPVYRKVRTCPVCHGTGHTPGVLSRLLAREPVQVVTLSDIHPDPTSGDMWIWNEEAFEQWPDMAEHFGQFAYDSAESACKAMSDWLLKKHLEMSHGSQATA